MKGKLLKHLGTALFALVFLAGIGLLLYPTIADKWNAAHQSEAVGVYDELVDAVADRKKQEMLEAARTYNEALLNNENSDGTYMTPEEKAYYMSLLSVDGTNVMGYVTIPCISVRLPIYHTTEESVLQVGVGHLEGSSLPVGGMNTHCVLSGHSGLPSSRLFTDLEKVGIGEIFTLSVLGDIYAYEVDQTVIVLPSEADAATAIEVGMDYCTLLTCTPYGVNTHRLLVRGHRTELDADGEALIFKPDAKKIEPLVASIGIAVFLIVAVLLPVCGIVYLVRRRFW